MAVTPALLFNWLVSGKDTTSYVSLDEADWYMTTRVNSGDWIALVDATTPDDDARAIALMTATRAIEAYPGISQKKFDNYFGNQLRFFPYHDNDSIQGTVDSAGDDTLISSDLEDIQKQYDDHWNKGSVIITDGTGIGQIREITDFVSSTGTVTIDENWTTNPDTTSTFQLIQKLPDDIIRACCEIAYLYIPDATTLVITDTSKRDKLIAEGVESFRIGDHAEKFRNSKEVNGYRIPPVAIAILNKYITWFV